MSRSMGMSFQGMMSASICGQRSKVKSEQSLMHTWGNLSKYQGNSLLQGILMLGIMLRMMMGNHDTLFGSIRTSGDISIGKGCTVHGNLISTKGKVKIGRNSRILGKITADTIVLHETSKTDGALTALNGVTKEQDDLEGFGEIETKLFYGFLLLDDV